MSWKLLNSQVVFDKFMQIEERTYEMPDGQTKNFYIKMTKPAVCVLAITEDNQVITVEQFRPGPNKTLNELPGGYMDDGETPERSAARELREETGYEGDVQFVTECFDDAYNTMNRTCFVATNCKKPLARAESGTAPPNPSLARYRWTLIRSAAVNPI